MESWLIIVVGRCCTLIYDNAQEPRVEEFSMNSINQATFVRPGVVVRVKEACGFCLLRTMTSPSIQHKPQHNPNVNTQYQLTCNAYLVAPEPSQNSSSEHALRLVTQRRLRRRRTVANLISNEPSDIRRSTTISIIICHELPMSLLGNVIYMITI